MVTTSLVAVRLTRGARNPLSVASTCNLAEALGVVVPIPTCAKEENPEIRNTFFIFFCVIKHQIARKFYLFYLFFLSFYKLKSWE